jgi:membrane-bound lytic murein transglycosylase D
MTKTIVSVLKISFCLSASTFFGGVSLVNAQALQDSSLKKLVVAVETNDNASYIVKEANVAYPSLLDNTEQNAAEYIEKFSTNRREYIMRMYKKGKSFFPKAVKVLRKYNLPQEYKVLIAIESAFNGNAVSHCGAVGYWQIMDGTAAEYGMKYEPQLSAAERKKLQVEEKLALAAGAKKEKKQVVKDDRKNFLKSTYAAAKYLRDRTKNLHSDPLLVVASYNCGVGNVWNAIKKSGIGSPTFWDIKSYLPTETQNYVMNFITLNVIFNNYEKFKNNTLNFKPIKIKVGNIATDADEQMEAMNDY